MNLNLNNANRKMLSALNYLKMDIQSLNDIEDLSENDRESITRILESVDSIIGEFKWTTKTVGEFMIELRDSKSEGEAVIDEFITVLCLGKKEDQS